MKIDDHFKIAVIVIASVIAGVALVIICYSCMNKKKTFQPPEPPQWQQMIVSAPTQQPRKTHVEIDLGRSGTIGKPVVPLFPYAVDDSLLNKAPKKLRKLDQGKRDDSGFGATAASTSDFSGGCGGGGDSGCGDGSSSGGGGGCGGC